MIDDFLSKYLCYIISFRIQDDSGSFSIAVVCTFLVATAVMVLLRYVQPYVFERKNKVHPNLSKTDISNDSILRMNPADVVPLIGSRFNPSLSPAENAQNLLRHLLLTANSLSEKDRLSIAYCMHVFHKRPEELIVPQSLLESHDPDAMGDEVRRRNPRSFSPRPPPFPSPTAEPNNIPYFLCIAAIAGAPRPLTRYHAAWQVEDVDGSVHEWLRSEFTRAVPPHSRPTRAARRHIRPPRHPASREEPRPAGNRGGQRGSGRAAPSRPPPAGGAGKEAAQRAPGADGRGGHGAGPRRVGSGCAVLSVGSGFDSHDGLGKGVNLG
jgi:hypothetical protein